MLQNISKLMAQIKYTGTLKVERVLTSAQGTMVKINGRDVLNLCSNNYLGLADDDAVKKASIDAILSRGIGLASGRIICGYLILLFVILTLV